MAKKKKAAPAKSPKKNTAKKPVKKAAKPAAKKKPASKSNSKPQKAKKAVKAPKNAIKPLKKTAKPIKAVKTKTGAKIVKKAIKEIKKAKPAIAQRTVTAKTKPVTKAKPEKIVKSKAVEKPVVKEKAVEKIAPVTEILTKKQIAEKKAQEVLAISNTIPVKAKDEISLSKIASISSSITNPGKRIDSYSVKAEKEPAGKFEMEFVVHASAEMLYEFLSTSSGLSEWFCDDLNIRNGIYTFIWEEQLQQARLLKTIDLQLVRFQWVDKTDGSYFEFRIQRDDLTNDISLIITDFADSVAERESSKLLWQSQIEKLMHVIGSIF